MAKQNGKKITMDGLARIINDGFNGQVEYMKKEFLQLASKEELKEVRKDVKEIKIRLTSVETKLDKVDDRLKHVETVLTDAHVL